MIFAIIIFQNMSCFSWRVSLGRCDKRQRRGHKKGVRSGLAQKERSLWKRKNSDRHHLQTKQSNWTPFFSAQPSLHCQALFYMVPRLPSSYATETRYENNKINQAIRVWITEHLFTETNNFYISALFLLPAAVISVSLTHGGVKTSWGLPGWILLS